MKKILGLISIQWLLIGTSTIFNFDGYIASLIRHLTNTEKYVNFDLVIILLLILIISIIFNKFVIKATWKQILIATLIFVTSIGLTLFWAMSDFSLLIL